MNNDLNSQDQLQSILMKLSSQYINMPLHEVDNSIQESLGTIGKFVGADRCYIFEYDFKNKTCSNTFEWCDSDIIPQIDELQDVPIEAIPDWVNTHLAGKQMLVPDVLSLPEGNALREILEPQGIKSLITLPMNSGESCIGFIGFDWVNNNHQTSEKEISLLAVFAELLVNINNRKETETLLKMEKQNVEASNKALSEFAYIASHDLREPLRKISAFGSILNSSLSARLTGDDLENLNFMIDGAKRMQQMIDDLLYYSRIISKTENYTEIDVDELVNEIINFDLAVMIKESNAEIIFDGKLGRIKGERTQIKQLFQNLISNGLKYSKKDSNPEIKIRSCRQQQFVEYFISDNGIGIEKRYQQQIFEMFKRLHSKEEFEGTGIGLAVCKRIIELYRGTIRVDSRIGDGSTFIFTIPLKD